jgi:threonine-phosphate decarboxylase
MQVKTKAGSGNLIDFSASLNPYPPETGWDPSSVSILEYPDDSYYDLKESIAENFGCRPEEICVGNGSIEVIRSFFHAVLDDGDRVAVDRHTFGEYQLSVALAGGSCVDEKSGDYSVRVICNPNNPTGSLIKKDEMKNIAGEEYDRGRLLFLDEAFMDLSDTNETLIGCNMPGVFISRSITKSFSVPGIRFGFGIGEPELIEKIEIVRTPWTVNSYAAAYCMEAMKHYNELEHSIELIENEKKWLYNRIKDLGLEFLHSHTNFILLKCPVPASEFTATLLDHDIFVRDCTSFGLPYHIRIAVRKRDDNLLLMEAIESCLR